MEKKKLIFWIKMASVVAALVVIVCLIIFVFAPLIASSDIENYYTVKSVRGTVATYYTFANPLQSSSAQSVTDPKGGICDLKVKAVDGAVREIKVGDIVKKGDLIVKIGSASYYAYIDGIVTNIFVYDGQTVLKNAKIIDISDLENFRIFLTVSEYDIKNINVGDKAEVKLNANGAKFNGTIMAKSLIANAANGVGYFGVTVEFNKIADYIKPKPDEIDEGKLDEGGNPVGTPPIIELPLVTSGMTCQVKLTKDIVKNIVKVPMKAIQMDSSNRAFIQIIDETGKRLKRVNVKVGLNDGKDVEIIDGIDANAVIYYPKAGATKTLLDSIR